MTALDFGVWKQFRDMPYFVRADGAIASLRCVLKPRPERKGYPDVTLKIRGRNVKFKVHVMVAEAFIGPRPYGHHVNHIDGDKTNNRVENLEYVTPHGNNVHAMSLGLMSCGSDRYNAKLTEQRVADMRLAYQRGQTVRSLADTYSVSFSAARAAISGKTWRHVA